jgi:hypothetical protein
MSKPIQLGDYVNAKVSSTDCWLSGIYTRDIDGEHIELRTREDTAFTCDQEGAYAEALPAFSDVQKMASEIRSNLYSCKEEFTQ